MLATHQAGPTEARDHRIGSGPPISLEIRRESGPRDFPGFSGISFSGFFGGIRVNSNENGPKMAKNDRFWGFWGSKTTDFGSKNDPGSGPRFGGQK